MLKKLGLITSALVLIFTVNASAQTKEDAINTFNSALEIAKSSDYIGAAKKLEECVEICNKLGAEGDDTKSEATKRIPSLYFQHAASIYKQKKYPEAIEAFSAAKVQADKYGDAQIKSKAAGVIPQLYYSLGVNSFKKQEYDESISLLNSAIENNPKYAKAFYSLGLVYKNLDDLDKMIENMDLAIQFGLETNDSKTVREAEEATYKQMVFVGANLTSEKRFNDAVALLKRSLEYKKDDADVYYRLSEVYNKQARFNDAIDNANQALQLEKGGKSESAKIYYELGYAYKFLDNKARACEAFTNAAYGSFTQSANYEIEHELKCKSDNP